MPFRSFKDSSGMGQKPGVGEALARGTVQGLTLGFGDELKGAIGSLTSVPGQWLYEKLNQDAYKSPSSVDVYRAVRDADRTANAAAEDAHPNWYTGGNIAGGLAPSVVATLATGGAAAPAAAARLAPALLSAAVQGGLQGAGYSDADATRGEYGRLVGDSSLGAGLGLASVGVGKAIGAARSGVANYAGKKAGQAAAKAAEDAAAEEVEKVASATGKFGGLRQTENKSILSLLQKEESGQLNSENKALLDTLRKTGRLEEALNESAKNDIEFLTERMGAVKAAKEDMLALRAALPENIARRTAELSESQVGKDTLSFVKSYGEPIAAGYAAGKVADAVGASEEDKLRAEAIAGLLFARTRAGKALSNRINRPGNQIGLWGGIQNLTAAPTGPSQVVSGALLRSTMTPAIAAVLSDRNEDLGKQIAASATHDPMTTLRRLSAASPDLQQAAQEGGKQGLASENYTLSQQSPEYRRLKNAVGGGKK